MAIARAGGIACHHQSYMHMHGRARVREAFDLWPMIRLRRTGARVRASAAPIRPFVRVWCVECFEIKRRRWVAVGNTHANTHSMRMHTPSALPHANCTE